MMSVRNVPSPGRLNLAFDSERNTSILNEFIGYADLTDLRGISPNIPGIMTNQKVSGNFDG